MNEIKQYGFKLNEVEDLSAYKLGAIELPKTVFRLDGNWEKFLPKDELQHTPSYDTFGCTVYGTENIKQTLENFHTGVTKEYSERYPYNLAKIIPPGADPHDVAEVFRQNGVIPYEELPMTSTLAEYAKPRPVPTNLVAKGIAHPWELRHQWLWQKPIDKATRTKLLKEYLQYGPLGVSVTAWKLENGVYVDNGQPNTHWTELYGWSDKGWLIYDSYAPHRKILSFDHNIQVCKRYILVANTRKQQVSIMQSLLNALLSLLGLLKAQTPTPPPKPQPEPVLPPLQALKWSTPEEARHSVRVLCDMEGLSVADKNILCATVGAESGWKVNAKNENFKNGKVVSTDWGIAQINDFYHIGQGKSFPSVDYVLTNPETVIRWMCKQWKLGNQNWWVAHKNGSFTKFL